MSQELLQALSEANNRTAFYQDSTAILGAIQEIERLRASQFRWIPVGERLPTVSDGLGLSGYVLVKTNRGDFDTWSWDSFEAHHVTHWAPIPPLPEKSQDSKTMVIDIPKGATKLSFQYDES